MGVIKMFERKTATELIDISVLKVLSVSLAKINKMQWLKHIIRREDDNSLKKGICIFK